jgi:23S rRNA pseudouridine1911/1915/1917 synthase
VIREFPAPVEAAGKRLDVFLCRELAGISRNQVQHLIDSGRVKVNGKSAPAGRKLKGGEEIAVDIPPVEPHVLTPEALPLAIVYEDEDLLVLNKPPGLVVHPGAGRKDGTLVNALLAHTRHLAHLGDPFRPGIVHRLDKDTSGLMVVAKTDPSYAALATMIQARRVSRRYLALVWGTPPRDKFTIEAPIGRKPSDRKQMAVVTAPGHIARAARTDIQVLEKYGEITLLEAALSTGRTHQVRVHLSYLGHPVVGDPTYGSRLARGETARLDLIGRQLVEALPGQALHAYLLAFPHPGTGQELTFRAEPPEAFTNLLDHLRVRATNFSASRT